jgi:DNA-binding MarR family transcriptional regulator
MLDRLQRRGLLTRDVHPDDRRRRQLHRHRAARSCSRP